MYALLLIDIQVGLDESEHWGDHRNNPKAEENCRKLLDYFRQRSWPLFHIKHNSLHPESPLFPGKPGNAIKPIVTPAEGETVIEKQTNSAFIGTGLEDILKKTGISSLVVAGLTTDHCVSATVRNAADLGFETILVSDATATYAKSGVDDSFFDAETMHATTLASLKDEFATILDTDSLLDEFSGKGTNL